LLLRRTQGTYLVPLLVGAVLGLDLIWALLEGSTGALGYGLVDEPAHLATCAVALLALTAALGRGLSSRFIVAALLASVLIDLDHIPGLLGSQLMSAGMPRPFTHTALLAFVLALAGWASQRPARRQLCLGAALGVSAHLLRDLATGSGVPLAWPLSDGIAHAPYEAFAITLVLLGTIAAGLSRPARLRPRAGIAVFAGLLALMAVAAIAPRPAEAYRVSIGGYVPGADSSPHLIEGFGEEIGRQPAIVLSYKDWDQAPFVYDQLDGIWGQGAIPMVTWEAWGSSEAGIPLWGIAHGSYDGYVRDAARAAAGWGRPLMVRFGQEMNAGWFPWGSQARAFKAAWRHLVRVFREEGATNVRWIWTPYVNSGGSLPFERYYPGGHWVDWVGLDGINWGGSFAWRSFGQVFSSSYRELVKISSKPMLLAETGSGENGGHKARWLSSMLRRVVPRMQHLRAILFWSVADHRGDIRVDSSTGALDALRRGLQMPLYDSSRQAVTQTPALLGDWRKHHRRRSGGSRGGK
jgi:membrane-bound metal-dependent hydrolase YbcI (DUF457 family)